jgi:hypothetical protein
VARARYVNGWLEKGVQKGPNRAYIAKGSYLEQKDRKLGFLDSISSFTDNVLDFIDLAMDLTDCTKPINV